MDQSMFLSAVGAVYFVFIVNPFFVLIYVAMCDLVQDAKCDTC